MRVSIRARRRGFRRRAGAGLTINWLYSSSRQRDCSLWDARVSRNCLLALLADCAEPSAVRLDRYGEFRSTGTSVKVRTERIPRLHDRIGMCARRRDPYGGEPRRKHYHRTHRPCLVAQDYVLYRGRSHAKVHRFHSAEAGFAESAELLLVRENRKSRLCALDKDACDRRIATLACDEDPVVAQLLGGGRVAVAAGYPQGSPLQPRATVNVAVATLPGSMSLGTTGRTVDARLKER